MPQYLITDIRSNVETWVTASSVREALIAHENAWRDRPLPTSTKVSDYSQGSVMDVSLGESVCRGRIENVVNA